MSDFSRWWDNNISHESERREARSKAEKQEAEYNKLRDETKAKSDQLKKEKAYEENRLSKNKNRRRRGGQKNTGFLSEASPSELKTELG